MTSKGNILKDSFYKERLLNSSAAIVTAYNTGMRSQPAHDEDEDHE